MNRGARGGPSRQLNVLLPEETKNRLEDLAVVLEKSQASIVATAINQLFESLDEKRRDELQALRSLRAKIVAGDRG